ncbi:MAG: ABC transporter ATP-binding protein/permease [Clostridiales bacterium]|nr:ABC transporter ATP-binding protein/permease [Clostridiales bacterium]
MLELNDIKKDYAVAGEKVQALKGISLKFRKSEFVSILGPSGCGKTTLLNIIGGLDKYTSGDLVIEGRSTKQYGDGDWDTYRNHSIGFIFQSYHLIPHQTILQNVELALMISGVSKQERRQRAIDALEKVGLKGKLNNRPNQLSGGQAQRVAIARALINDPEIVLADEPTGALDSVTSVQIMELLKEISKDRLVIMVTHNPELAEQYSTRIVRLLDGEVVDDSMPYDGGEAPEEVPSETEERAEITETNETSETTEAIENAETIEKTEQPEGGAKTNKGKKKKTSMSPLMAMGLSLKNLLSKSKRTAMVSVAGSIGVIGVSLVLAISAGVKNYIRSMENDMLSGNPVSITRSAIDFSSLMDMSSSSKPKVNITKLDDKLYVRSLMDTLGTFAKGLTKTNNITPQYVDYIEKMNSEWTNVVQYTYDFNPANNIYTGFKVADGLPEQTVSVTGIRGMYSQILSEQEEYKNFTGTISSISTFGEVPDNYDYIFSQFDVVAYETASGVSSDGKSLTDDKKKEIFSDPNSLIMVVDDSMITDIALGQYGYLTQQQFLNYAFNSIRDENGENVNYNEQLGLVGSGITNGVADPENGLDLSYFIGENSKKFTYYPNNDAYYEVGEGSGFYVHRPYISGNFALRTDAEGNLLDGEGKVVTEEAGNTPAVLPVPNIEGDGEELSVKLILQKKKNISYSCLDPGVYYTRAHTERVLKDANESNIVRHIKSLSENAKYLNMLPYFFNYTSISKGEGEQLIYTPKAGMSFIYDSGDIMSLMMSGLSDPTERDKMLQVTAEMLGGSELPSAIYIYPTDFTAKDKVCSYLDKWNAMCSQQIEYPYTVDGVEVSDNLKEDMQITYSDNVGLIINMINTMIEMITVALVAFTALSLVVSTVMIGIITYVSVVERIKEIGILRAVGARKKDISRLFNAETFIIGLVAGLFGILVTYLVSVILNAVVYSLVGIAAIAALPWWQAIIMVLVSVGLTLISGLIPAAAAAKKDPVVALRTE